MTAYIAVIWGQKIHNLQAFKSGSLYGTMGTLFQLQKLSNGLVFFHAQVLPVKTFQRRTKPDEMVTKLKRQKRPKRLVVNYQINVRGTVINDKTMTVNYFRTLSVNLSSAKGTKRRRFRSTSKL